jgi:hypothetical protein
MVLEFFLRDQAIEGVLEHQNDMMSIYEDEYLPYLLRLCDEGSLPVFLGL